MGKSSRQYRHPWDAPDCPECDGHLFVGGAPSNELEAECYRCGIMFDPETGKTREKRATGLPPEASDL